MFHTAGVRERALNAPISFVLTYDVDVFIFFSLFFMVIIIIITYVLRARQPATEAKRKTQINFFRLCTLHFDSKSKSLTNRNREKTNISIRKTSQFIYKTTINNNERVVPRMDDLNVNAYIVLNRNNRFFWFGWWDGNEYIK